MNETNQMKGFGLRFAALASGSGGNAYYVETGTARVLVDAGLSCRELTRRLTALAVQPQGLDALFISHEHGDHIRGAGPLSRRFKIPVYANPGALERGCRMLGNLHRTVPFETGQSVQIKDLTIESFSKCHDAADPMGFVFSFDGIRLGLLTDIGQSTRLVEDRLRACQGLILEFNHDPRMLATGPYPLDVKHRIGSRDGHLSNQQAAELLRAVVHRDLRVLMLAHLSETNNQPELALQSAREVLRQCGLSTTQTLVARQHEPGPVISVRPRQANG